MNRNASQETVEAKIRPVPRYGVFMGAGVIIGIVIAAILTATGSFEQSEVAGVVYPPGQVFGFLLLWAIPVGLALGGIVALIFDRTARRKARTVQVRHESVETPDETPES